MTDTYRWVIRPPESPSIEFSGISYTQRKLNQDCIISLLWGQAKAYRQRQPPLMSNIVQASAQGEEHSVGDVMLRLKFDYERVQQQDWPRFTWQDVAALLDQLRVVYGAYEQYNVIEGTIRILGDVERIVGKLSIENKNQPVQRAPSSAAPKEIAAVIQPSTVNTAGSVNAGNKTSVL
ncbi:uncharacterized protein KY384_004647 [Bacidia gigantensis]|uniref:uncharacterized protein n=1 Tax=Bacidia gigantensis TaxID=2732470 RepID=UPI001D057754|nr:uncharacterized protein KY384_004647 [Bacidia gigantensis]KAG8530609.1 hypothetical protein KY384_004647 [Bacidia gigantensis]